MRYITLLLLIGFIAVSVFGFGFMAHERNHTTSNCIASVVDKITCLQNRLSVALHHINSYQVFSQIPVSSIFIALLLILTLSATLRIFLKNLPPNYSFAQLLQSVQYKSNDPEPSLYQTRKITHWLSLFENSPSFS